jgi:hypothetical protein
MQKFIALIEWASSTSGSVPAVLAFHTSDFESDAAATGQTLWIVDAHRDDGKRFVVHADERLTAFLELESATRATLVPGDLAAPCTKETRSFQLTMKMVLLVRFCGSMPIDCANASA